MNAVDTNILIYIHDPRDPAKQAAAAALVQAQTDAVLLWQVACEYLAASRKLAAQGYGFEQAQDDIEDLAKAWSTALPSWGILDRSGHLMKRYSLSFWDAMLIAACLEAGVTRLYSEDFDAYPKIDGLEIVNPFLTAR